MKIVASENVFNPTTAIASAREEVLAAQIKVNQAKKDMAATVSKCLRDNPDMVITCGALGRSFGIRACEAGRIMEDFGKDVTVTGVSVVRKFAEISESGELVQGGQVKTVKGFYTGYTARKDW